jgi:hypothetical protein
MTKAESLHRPGEGGGGKIREVDADTDSRHLDDLVTIVSRPVVLQRANQGA